jgi:hypothetical protein
LLAHAYAGQKKLIDFWHANFKNGLFERWSLRDGWNFLGDWLTPHGSEPSVTPEVSHTPRLFYLFILFFTPSLAIDFPRFPSLFPFSF